MKDERIMPSHELPDNDAWIARFKAFKSWVDEHGALPKSNPEGGPEDTLRTWLDRQCTDIQNSSLAPRLEAILRSVPGAVPRLARRKSAASSAFPPGNGRLDNLELFFQQHGRLPRYSGTAPGEESMYKYLNDTVRVRYRRDELPPEMLERLNKIPGVFTARKIKRREDSVPRQPTERALRIKAGDTRMADLIAFCTEHGRLPSATGAGTEPSLYNYLRRIVRPSFKSGTLDPETVKALSAVDGLLVPRRRGVSGNQLAELVDFCTRNSRKPRSAGPDDEPALYEYLRRVVRPAYAAGTLDEVTAKRLAAVDGVLTTRAWTAPSSAKAA